MEGAGGGDEGREEGEARGRGEGGVGGGEPGGWRGGLQPLGLGNGLRVPGSNCLITLSSRAVRELGFGIV